MMIKLTNILNELNVNNPNVTVEKVYKYFKENIYSNNEFRMDRECWRKYKELCKPYCEKYNIFYYLERLDDFKKLSSSDLNKFYREMRALVRKYVGKEIL